VFCGKNICAPNTTFETFMIVKSYSIETMVINILCYQKLADEKQYAREHVLYFE
jgi:hypothetical protein